MKRYLNREVITLVLLVTAGSLLGGWLSAVFSSLNAWLGLGAGAVYCLIEFFILIRFILPFPSSGIDPVAYMVWVFVAQVLFYLGVRLLPFEESRAFAAGLLMLFGLVLGEVLVRRLVLVLPGPIEEANHTERDAKMGLAIRVITSQILVLLTRPLVLAFVPSDILGYFAAGFVALWSTYQIVWNRQFKFDLVHYLVVSAFLFLPLTVVWIAPNNSLWPIVETTTFFLGACWASILWANFESSQPDVSPRI